MKKITQGLLLIFTVASFINVLQAQTTLYNLHEQGQLIVSPNQLIGSHPTRQNINSPAGTHYQDIKRSRGILVFNRSINFFVLLNNPSNTKNPHMLTSTRHFSRISPGDDVMFYGTINYEIAHGKAIGDSSDDRFISEVYPVYAQVAYLIEGGLTVLEITEDTRNKRFLQNAYMAGISLNINTLSDDSFVRILHYHGDHKKVSNEFSLNRNPDYLSYGLVKFIHATGELNYQSDVLPLSGLVSWSVFNKRGRFIGIDDYDLDHNRSALTPLTNEWCGFLRPPIRETLDPENTYITDIPGGYLNDLIPIPNDKKDFKLVLGPGQSLRTSLYSPERVSIRSITQPTNNHTIVYKWQGIRGIKAHTDGIGNSEVVLSVYFLDLVNGPNGQQYEKRLLYGGYLDANTLTDNDGFGAKGWICDNPLSKFPNCNRRYPRFAGLPIPFTGLSTSFRPEYLNAGIQESVRLSQLHNDIRLLSRVTIPIQVEIENKVNNNNLATIQALAYPGEIPTNALQLFKPKEVADQFQYIKYDESRGKKSDAFHIKSISISQSLGGNDRTIKTGDNGGYLNLVNPVYKLGPIKTSIKEKNTANPEKYDDILPNFVTIQMDIHKNPQSNIIGLPYGVWIDYFNTEELQGINSRKNTYGFVDEGLQNGEVVEHHIENVKKPYGDEEDGHPNYNDANNFAQIIEDIGDETKRITFTFKMPSAEEIQLGKERTTRLRIGLHQLASTEGDPDPFTESENGEVEDYMIEIQAPTNQEISEAIRSTAKVDIRAPKRRRTGEPNDNSYTGSAGDHFQQFSNSNSNTPPSGGSSSFSEQAALLMQYPIGEKLTNLTNANLITSNFRNWGQAGDGVFSTLLQEVRNVFNQYYAFLPNDLTSTPPADSESTIKFEDLNLFNFTNNPQNPFIPSNADDDINNGNPANDENPLGIDDLFPLTPIPSRIGNPFESQDIDNILENQNNKAVFWQLYNNIVRFALHFYDTNARTLDQKFLNSLDSNAADNYWWIHNFLVNELQKFQNDQGNVQRAEKIVKLFEDLMQNPRNALDVKFIFSKIAMLVFEYALTVPVEFLPTFISEDSTARMLFLLRDYMISYFIAMRNMSWFISQGSQAINLISSKTKIALDMMGEWIPKHYKERVIGSELSLKNYPKTEFDLAVIYHAKGSNNEVILGIDHQGLLEYHVRLGEVKYGMAYWQTVKAEDQNNIIPLNEIVTVKVKFDQGTVSLFLNDKKVGTTDLKTQSGVPIQEIDGYLNFTDLNYGALWGGPLTNFDGVETYPNEPNLVDLDGLFYRFLGFGSALSDELIEQLVPSENTVPFSARGVNATPPASKTGANSIGATQEKASEAASSDFSIFPNPAKDKLNIIVEIQQAGELSINIFDLAGKQVYDMQEPQISKGHQLITLRNLKLSAGQYIVKVKAGDVNQSEQVMFE